MGVGRDLYEEWCRRGVPVEASADDVLAVVEEYFSGCYKRGKGSHVCIVRHPWLAAMPRLSRGLLTLFLRRGMVPREALADLVFAVRCVECLRERDWPADKAVPRQLGEALEREFG